jgi:hypothetical protein
MNAKGVSLVRENPATIKAFQTRRLHPDKRRMATLAGAHSRLIDTNARQNKWWPPCFAGTNRWSEPIAPLPAASI